MAKSFPGNQQPEYQLTDALDIDYYEVFSDIPKLTQCHRKAHLQFAQTTCVASCARSWNDHHYRWKSPTPWAKPDSSTTASTTQTLKSSPRWREDSSAWNCPVMAPWAPSLPSKGGLALHTITMFGSPEQQAKYVRSRSPDVRNPTSIWADRTRPRLRLHRAVHHRGPARRRQLRHPSSTLDRRRLVRRHHHHVCTHCRQKVPKTTAKFVVSSCPRCWEHSGTPNHAIGVVARYRSGQYFLRRPPRCDALVRCEVFPQHRRSAMSGLEAAGTLKPTQAALASTTTRALLAGLQPMRVTAYRVATASC